MSTDGCPVLIVTTTDDAHADIMIEELQRRDVPVIRFHPEDFPVRSSITLFGTDSGRDWNGVITTQGREVRLSEIRSAWYRRPRDPAIAESIPAGLTDFALVNARDVLNAAYALIEDRWLASPHRLRWAELKPVQLMAAARAGLPTPLTIFSNDPGEVERFHSRLTEQRDRCAVKSLRTTHAVTYDQKIWLPYTAVWPDDLPPTQAGDIALTPAIYQRYLPKHREVRAVMIGAEVFAASVDPAVDPDCEVDMRKGELTKDWASFTLPEDIAAALVTMTRGLGLHCCSADFIVTPDGNLIFIELNPNGQWLWLDLYAGLPLVQKFADHLCAGIGQRGGERSRA